MTICTNCGAIFNEVDAEKHTCDENLLPPKGKEIKIDGATTDI